MDFGFNEEQEMLRKMARDFLVNECPTTLVREMMGSDQGYSPELWRKMADLGWFGLVVPEQYGGMGMSYLDLTVLLEEMGRSLVPSAFMSTVILGTLPIVANGTEEQKAAILPKVASGNAILTMALSEPDTRYDLAKVSTKAALDSDGEKWVINGTKLFVPDAHVADTMLVVARTSVGASKEDGLTIFIVDAKSPGITITLLKTMDQTTKQCEVVLENVQVPRSSVLGEVGRGWPIIRKTMNQTIVGLCSDAIGGAQQVLDLSVEYAKTRVQYGRPIGSFQAIKHKAANMMVDVECAKSLAYYAAWAVDESDENEAMAVSMAKAWCSDTYKSVSGEGIQIHGGIGFTWDHDMHMYFKRARMIEVAYGDGDHHRELVAQMAEI